MVMEGYNGRTIIVIPKVCTKGHNEISKSSKHGWILNPAALKVPLPRAFDLLGIT